MYSENVLAGCCVYPTNQGGGCSIYMTGGTCSGGSPDTKDCTEITKCNVGCWCDINDPVKNQIGYVNSGSGGVGFSGSFKLLSEYKPNPSAECDVICTGTKCTKDIKIICPNNDEITIATCDVGSGTIKIIGNNCGTPIAWTDEAKAAAGTTEIPVDECSNEIKDSGETDIDCGGSCPKCADGKSCSLNSDCQNNNCVNDVCTSNLCGNGVCDTGENSQNCIYDCNVCTDDILFNEECNSGSSCIKGTCLSSCKCDYTCIDNPPAPSNVQVLDVKNQKALSVEWNMIAKSGCDLSQILVYRCGEEGNTAECDPTDLVGEITPSLSLVNYNFPDKKEIKPETMYCYKVTAYYKNSGAEASSDVVCDTTGMEKCMEGRSKFCEENTLQTCNDNNDRENPAGYPCRTENNQDPRDIQYCLELDNGNAQCVFQNDCDLCNGVFGLFASSGETLRKISLTGGGTSYGFYSCKSLADGNELKTCFFDVTKTTINVQISFHATAMAQKQLAKMTDAEQEASRDANGNHQKQQHLNSESECAGQKIRKSRTAHCAQER
ncbi:MAG: hypothetical protein NT001_05965 [Candidatus Woesearchaeota archaeon]|nr:hypothetical protein [Candidatus Woesearchaeota archaeon]